MKKRSFNAEGPCNPHKHYMIDALRGMEKEILSLIDDEKYFVIHASRQSGKTTLLQALIARINAEGNYYALYCSLENLEGVADAAIGIPAIIEFLKSSLKNYALPNASSFADDVNLNSPLSALQDALVAYCRTLSKPLVLLFDEADCLSGATLIAFLRQLRNGYINRTFVPFVHSLALVGMRNIRDYRSEYRDPAQTLGSSSPFNIVAESMTLNNFTKEEIAALYAQHTADTGQVFEDEAIDVVCEQTCGQPWLVSATAKVIVKMTADAPMTTVNADMVTEAIQILILRNDTHFDSLMARLHEERVRRIIEPVIIGQESALDLNSDDYSYVKDMGLIRDDRGKTEPANPIYGEIIIRTLSRNVQAEIGLKGYTYPIPRYLEGGKIDMNILLSDFQIFWRENEAIWQKKFDYQEAAPQLIMQAFLQRVINGGGRIDREMAAATGRVDLCVEYQSQRYPIELKIRRHERTYIDGLKQTASYLHKLGCAEGWLILFDQRADMSWEDKLYVKQESIEGKTVTVFGC
ncbi:MAG: ATP-binding protein [Clostridiales bacterium]|nr:ATP-binding protein [Clostridiales bacterium]